MIFNEDQNRWWLCLELSDVSKDVALRWARVQMNPDRASRIWRGLRRKDIQYGCMSGLAAAVRRYLLDAGRWREIYEPGSVKKDMSDG
jgi:hypothetical protein